MTLLQGVLSVCIGISTLVSIGIGVFVAWLAQKQRADFAEFRGAMIEMVRGELKAYLDVITFNRYVESHAKEVADKEKTITEFMTRHRDWKHTIEPVLRGLQTDDVDFKKITADNRDRIEAIEKNLIEINMHLEQLKKDEDSQ